MIRLTVSSHRTDLTLRTQSSVLLEKQFLIKIYAQVCVKMHLKTRIFESVFKNVEIDNTRQNHVIFRE